MSACTGEDAEGSFMAAGVEVTKSMFQYDPRRLGGLDMPNTSGCLIVRINSDWTGNGESLVAFVHKAYSVASTLTCPAVACPSCIRVPETTAPVRLAHKAGGEW